MLSSTQGSQNQPTSKIDYSHWDFLLCTQQLPIKIQEFRKWYKNSQQVQNDINTFPDREYLSAQPRLLHKDIVRTRSTQSYMKDPKFLRLLQCVAVFYCKSNSVNYQQGLLEVLILSFSFRFIYSLDQIIVPFLLIKSHLCKVKKCYAYFNVFMDSYFPSLLTPKIVHNKKELPLAAISINLASILLNYFYPKIFYHLKSCEVPLSMVFTSELMTIFARNLPIPLVYQVFDFFILKSKTLSPKFNENQQNESLIVLLLMCVSLIGLREQQIMQKTEQQIFTYIGKSLKPFKVKQELTEWFNLCDSLISKLPKQFSLYCASLMSRNQNMNFNEDKFYLRQQIHTQETYETMMRKDRENLNYLIEVKQLGDFDQQVVFVAVQKNKVIKKLLKYNQNVFLIQKVSQINREIEELQSSFLTKFKITQQNYPLVLIVVQSCLLSSSNEINDIGLLQKMIQLLQTKHHIKCMKISEDLIANSIQKRKRKESNKSHCNIF